MLSTGATVPERNMIGNKPKKLSNTAWSEWYNVQVKASWAYSDWMPLLPGFEIGLSPLAQWLVVPCVGLWWARRSRR